MELLEQLQATLGDAYRIEREFAGGGMARVFVAQDLALGRRVVVKVLSPELAAGVSARRFAREIRLAASLQHANIVPVLSAGETDGVPHYTMPLVEGASLRERLEREPRPPLVETIGILRDVARALAYAHERGVVHRDIKPDNVLLSGGAAMVTDFGIAKAISVARDEGEQAGSRPTTMTHAGMAMGTPAYMAPEQVAADPDIDHRADLYAFGCLAFELLAGRLPFTHKSAPQLLAAHLAEAPPSLGELCPDCPPALVRVIHQCLEKEPARRPQSAAEILRVLDAGVPTSSTLTRLRNRLSRRQRLALAIAGVAAVAAAVAVPLRIGRQEGVAVSVPSLAVLPFAIAGGDSSRAHWADGLTDELTIVLARRADVRLASRAAVERYRGRRAIDARDVGRVLQVDHVLHGTVVPQGGVFRVRAWLTRSDDGVDEWQDTFDGDAHDILAALDSITSGITLAVQGALLGEEAARTPTASATRGTSDSAAYDRYVRGQALLRERGAAIPRAAELFEEAARLDPNFAQAHAALAATLEVLPNFADSTYEDVRERVVAAAGRALALDSSIARAYGALALAAMHAMQWSEADSLFRLALARDSTDAETRMQYGRLLVYSGFWDDAVHQFELARRVDPASPVVGGWLAWTLKLNQRFDEAMVEINRALELDSTSVPIALMGAEVTIAAG
ncbi:MAG TPA: protein kinase, partial [Gemmatimonadaceae bacterium]